MPLYEYYCESCDGIFEALRSMRESSEPSPCPVCDRDGRRVMPTSFAAFTFRDGVPRRIPDRGTYWHLGKEVSKPITGGGVAYEHPEINKPTPRAVPTAAEVDEHFEVEHLKQQHAKQLQDSGITPPRGTDGKPLLSPKMGASGHAD